MTIIKKYVFIALICSCVVLFSIMVYFAVKHNRKEKSVLHIVCTTSIIADTVKNVVGKNAHVYALMGPNVDPHVYQARPSDIEQMLKADVVFSNGLHLEGKMGNILTSFQRSTGVDSYVLSDAIDPTRLLSADGFTDVYDPHIWFSIPLWQSCIVYIKDCLKQKDPIHESEYENNAVGFLKKLEELDVYVRNRVAEIPQEKRILLTAHDAFSYFGKEYGFNVISLQGISTDSEISIQDVSHMVNFIITHNIPAVFVEMLISQRSLESVQQAVAARGAHVAIGPALYTDALGEDGSGAEAYVGMVRLVVDRIVNTLKKENT